MNFPVTEPTLETDIDEATRQFVSFMAGRAINGKLLLEWIEKTSPGSFSWGTMAKKLNIKDLNVIIRPFREWCDRLNIRIGAQKPKAWRNEQLDHRFSMGSAAKEKLLVAPSYRSGELDWYSFNAFSAIRNIQDQDWTEQPSIITLPVQTRIRAPPCAGGSSRTPRLILAKLTRIGITWQN